MIVPFCYLYIAVCEML